MQHLVLDPILSLPRRGMALSASWDHARSLLCWIKGSRNRKVASVACSTKLSPLCVHHQLNLVTEIERREATSGMRDCRSWQNQIRRRQREMRRRGRRNLKTRRPGRDQDLRGAPSSHWFVVVTGSTMGASWRWGRGWCATSPAARSGRHTNYTDWAVRMRA
jgi:hypothetical protein